MPRNDDDDLYVIENAQADRETDRALLITDLDEEEQHWVPKSVIHDDSEVFEKGHKGKLVVKAWWARKNGFDPG